MNWYRLTSEEQTISMQRLRLRLCLLGHTGQVDVPVAELRAALERIPQITHYGVLHPIVLNDGIAAALHVLGDAELVTS